MPLINHIAYRYTLLLTNHSPHHKIEMRSTIPLTRRCHNDNMSCNSSKKRSISKR
nr:MAG TPA: hypothetical protein [Caudoviricetes sp.]